MAERAHEVHCMAFCRPLSGDTVCRVPPTSALHGLPNLRIKSQIRQSISHYCGEPICKTEASRCI